MTVGPALTAAGDGPRGTNRAAPIIFDKALSSGREKVGGERIGQGIMAAQRVLYLQGEVTCMAVRGEASPVLDPGNGSVELAYQILLSNGQPMHYRELIEEVIKIKSQSQLFASRGANPARLVAEIHTEINMDIRFQHLGKGLWGLRRWAPKQAVKGPPLIASLRGRRDDSYHHDDGDEEPHDEIDALRVDGEEEGNGWDPEPERDA